MFAEVFVVSLSILIIFFLDRTSKAEASILNVYRKSDKFYYVKFALMYFILQLRKRVSERKKGEKLIANKPFSELERAQDLPDDKRAVDAVYFSGGNRNGDYLIVATSRRKNKLIDGFLYLKLKNADCGILESLKLPSTDLLQEETEEGFSAEGIKIECAQPMSKWKINFDGKLKDNKKSYEVKLNLVFVSDLPYFNFDTDPHPFAMASAMAREKWSKTYFEILKAVHQTHYEQFGKIKGEAKIDGRTFALDFDVVRDHSFGLREWRSFHRYALHYFTAENGDHFAVLVISMPICFSSLTVGYVVDAVSKEVIPLKTCDFELYQQGEGQPPPVDYGFSFTAGNRIYDVEVNIESCPSFYISKDWESKVYEGMATYKVNGKRAWGIAEWQYRNIQGKDEVNENLHLINS